MQILTIPKHVKTKTFSAEEDQRELCSQGKQSLSKA